jgi:hypothetical protein
MCGISLVLSGDPQVVAPSTTAAAAAAAEIRHSGKVLLLSSVTSQILS